MGGNREREREERGIGPSCVCGVVGCALKLFGRLERALYDFDLSLTLTFYIL